MEIQFNDDDDFEMAKAACMIRANITKRQTIGSRFEETSTGCQDNCAIGHCAGICIWKMILNASNF
jgi:hypothetical protein